jgi:hypothetical protein
MGATISKGGCDDSKRGVRRLLKGGMRRLAKGGATYSRSPTKADALDLMPFEGHLGELCACLGILFCFSSSSDACSAA